MRHPGFNVVMANKLNVFRDWLKTERLLFISIYKIKNCDLRFRSYMVTICLEGKLTLRRQC